MIRLGLAAQTLSSAGGRQLAISRLISSGIALATQLQRGLVVRVVGAPLVRRRPQRRSRGASPEEYPEPSPASLTETAALDQEATGWEDVGSSVARVGRNREPALLPREGAALGRRRSAVHLQGALVCQRRGRTRRREHELRTDDLARLPKLDLPRARPERQPRRRSPRVRPRGSPKRRLSRSGRRSGEVPPRWSST